MGKPTISTISLAESVLQSFSRVETLLNSYQRLDRTARHLKRHILTVKTLFRSEIELLLPKRSAWGAGFSQGIRGSDPATKCTRNEGLLESDITIKLGRSYGRLRDSMRRARMALEGITEILEELARDTEERDWVSGILNLVVVGARIVLRSCLWVLMVILRALPIGRPEALVQIGVVAKGPVFECLRLGGSPEESKLDELLFGLSKDVDIISEVRQLAQEPIKSESNPLGTSAVSNLSTSGPHTNSENLESKPSCVILDKLYDLLSGELNCQCHFIHLCLCNVSAGPSSRRPMDQGSICSFFVTLDLDTSMDVYRAEDPRYLTASRPTGSTPPTLTPSPEGCSTIATSPPGSDHPLWHQSLTRIEFLLKSTRPLVCSLNSDTHSEPPVLQPILTLHELLVSHSQGESSIKLGDRDRLLLAAKLAQWVLQHNGTRWLCDLDAHKIRFFTRYESDLKYANWTPYLSTAFNQPSLPHERRGGELYALGLVLLELGLKEPLIDLSRNRAGAIKAASRKLLTSLGPGLRQYKSIVEKLLREGGSREETLISDLENEIKYIEEKARKFFPE